MTHGGVGTVRWRYFMEELPRHGWEVETVAARQGASTDEFSSDARAARLSGARAQLTHRIGRVAEPVAGRVLGVRPEALAPNGLWSFTGRRAIRTAVERVRPDVVVATSPPPAAIFAAVHSCGPMPVVADMRDLWAGHPYYDAGGRALTRIEDAALRRAAAVVCVTPGMQERLRALHPWLEPQLMPNGFHPKLIGMRGRTAPGKATVIHPGTLFAGRSVTELVDALGRRDLAGRVRLELVGNMNEASRTALAGAPAGLEIEITGPLPWEQTVERMSRSAIVAAIVPPGIGDDVAWPVKTLEALALGKPVLSISAGGAGEALLHELGQDAGAAHHDNPEGIAVALERLLADPPSPVPPDRLERWDRSGIAATYSALLDSLTG